MSPIINLTNQLVTVALPDDVIVTYPPSGHVASLKTDRIGLRELWVEGNHSIPVTALNFYGVDFDGIVPSNESYYIVTPLVKYYLELTSQLNRYIFLVPDNDNPVRDSHGRIIGVPGFTL